MKQTCKHRIPLYTHSGMQRNFGPPKTLYKHAYKHTKIFYRPLHKGLTSLLILIASYTQLTHVKLAPSEVTNTLIRAEFSTLVLHAISIMELFIATVQRSYLLEHYNTQLVQVYTHMLFKNGYQGGSMWPVWQS